MKKLIVGNWKMNGSTEMASQLVSGIAAGKIDNADVCVCPPYVFLCGIAAAAKQAGIAIGAQDCAYYPKSGAYTGDISASMVKDIGCRYVILGHSERRQYHAESNEVVKNKALRVHEEGLIAVICVGETDAEREAGEHISVVIMQLMESIPETASGANLVIAYEPVWAIGTGKTATEEDVAEMHGIIRRFVNEKLDNPEQVRILYGGSVKPENAASLLAVPHVDGALVGGASLKADQFLAIIAGAA
ncbi:MAG TPA: triose-phosphate isomerase [Alphaproteobacteria bacterium]|nr:triose-phosphate isomerase [Alphaproteobacteria bacterium]HNS44248.1 triose-phosphate isomerase [Alphaproteobacteria bacterium]